MDLRDYERIKFELAEILRSLPFEAAQFERRRELFARLAEDRFNLVVVGRFSRGKSSLMNAILGMDRLPTGVVPLTSVITTVTYGSEERVTLHYRGSFLIDDIKLEDLSKYITERGNPGNIRGIEIADVQLPAAILRRGFHFIDTPGLGSSIAQNTRTTEKFMPEADALILVTSFDSPLSEEEVAVLQSARRADRRVFLAVNKRDTVTAAEQEQVLAHVETQVRTVFGDSKPAIFPLSARDALAAKLAHDSEGLAASGVAALEQALIDFLVAGKRREFLLSMCARVRDVLGARDVAALSRLDALRGGIAEMGPVAAPPAETEPDLASDMPQCEVCLRVEQAVFSFLASFQSRLARDPGARSELADRNGFCGPHSWQFESIAAPRELCAAFAQLLESQAAQLRAVTARADAGRVDLLCESVEQMLPDADRCPACQIAVAVEQKTADSLAFRLEASPRAIPRGFSAICLPHLGTVLVALKDASLRAALMQRQANVLERFADDMRRFALKQDAARRWALNKEELGAAQRGSRALVGAPTAFKSGRRPGLCPGPAGA
jgi:small GTP-binding protein